MISAVHDIPDISVSSDIKQVTRSAHGRMDVLGGIADYSGSLLLQMPIAQATSVTIQERKDDYIYITSHQSAHEKIACIRLQLTDIKIDTQKDLLALRQHVISAAGSPWPLYIIGALIYLTEAEKCAVSGMHIIIESEVPIGKGVSSSAALEVATLRALRAYYEFDMQRHELAVLAQQIENNIVGAPCGLMDQLASCFGRVGHLLPLQCQPSTIYTPISIPEDMHFVGIDSGAYHTVSGNSYTSVRAAAFMGYTIIAKHMGISTQDIENAKETNDWTSLPYKGYLANCSVDDYQLNFADKLPDIISGNEFIDMYGTVIDPLTRIDRVKDYKVKSCTTHPIYENHRITHVYQQLQKSSTTADISALFVLIGNAMYAAHDSYTSCGLGHPQTDIIVDLVKQKGISHGLYGAKITGGGSGGTVCILAKGKKGLSSIRDIWHHYQQLTGQKVTFFESTSNL